MLKDDTIEAIFLATDAPSHARHCIDVLKHGKHVASAVPAVFGSLEDADKLLETVNSSGRKYMMFETSVFPRDCYGMRQIFRPAGSASSSTAKANTSTTCRRRSPRIASGGWGVRRNGIPRTRTPITSA